MLRAVDLLRARAGAAAGRLLDLALPGTCAGCAKEGEPICAACAPALHARERLEPGIPMCLPSDVPAPLLQLEWCAPFSGTVRRALHALKYAGELRLTDPLAGAVCARWRRAGAGGDLVVNVPVHAGRAAERGYDQAELRGRAVARELHLPFVPALVRSRATTAQFKLDRVHRGANVAGAFAIRPGTSARAVPGRWAILIDDVVTTGATLSACASALLDAGAIGVSAVTVARER